MEKEIVIFVRSKDGGYACYLSDASQATDKSVVIDPHRKGFGMSMSEALFDLAESVKKSEEDGE